MKNLRDLNKFIREILSEMPLVQMVDYGEKNIINAPQDFRPIQTAFMVTGLGGINEDVEEYTYTVVFVDKVAEDNHDLEEVHSKLAEVVNQFVVSIARSENYQVSSSNANLIVSDYNDKLEGFELLINITTHNSQDICINGTSV